MISYVFGFNVPVAPISNDEYWCSITLDGAISRFDVSNLGRVRTNFWGNGYKIMKQILRQGYNRIFFHVEHRRYHFTVSRLVAQLFIPNPLNLPEVNHKDLDKSNNAVPNLEWSTKKQNAEHAGKNGKLGRGSRKLPPKEVGKYLEGTLIKRYQSMGSVSKDNYPRVSVTRALESGKQYQGFYWKFL